MLVGVAPSALDRVGLILLENHMRGRVADAVHDGKGKGSSGGAPLGFQRLVVFNPLYWSMEAFDGGFLYLGLASRAEPHAIFLLVGVLGMVLGVQGLRRFEV